jgi:hypothetical protein
MEHAGRNWSGRFFNFNGTAGMWRRSAIADAGGWQHDTLTEDMDLSYRAQLRGWKFVYVPEITAPAELPVEMSAFKSQQFRWAKGSVQVARKLLGTILRSNATFAQKSEAFFHLTNNLAYPLLVVLSLLLLPNLALRTHNGWREVLIIDLPLCTAPPARSLRSTCRGVAQGRPRRRPAAADVIALGPASRRTSPAVRGPLPTAGEFVHAEAGRRAATTPPPASHARGALALARRRFASLRSGTTTHALRRAVHRGLRLRGSSRVAHEQAPCAARRAPALGAAAA